MEDVSPRVKAILSFWFGEDFLFASARSFPTAKRRIWFAGAPDVDHEIIENFRGDLENVAAGLYDTWLEHSYAGLAAVILMDQFTRSAYRGTPRMYALDVKAQTWARHLIESGRAQALTPLQRSFLFTPFEHSESLEHQEMGLRLLETEISDVEGLGQDDSADELLSYFRWLRNTYQQHRDLVAKFGRFPHRNQMLERANTPEEQEGLQNGSILDFQPLGPVRLDELRVPQSEPA